MNDIDLDRIATAASIIDPVFLNSPQYFDDQLCARLGRRVLTKIETLNPLRSFKGRGAELLVSDLTPGTSVVCGSTGGNFAQAIGYAARRRGLRAEVFVQNDLAPVKSQRLNALGAQIHLVESDPGGHAETFAAAGPDRYFAVDGRDAAAAEGAGTIGVELLRTGGFDTVVLPLGDGALITGVARWIKAHAPEIRIVGASSAAAPALERSWRAGKVLSAELRSTFAAGITIRQPEPEAVHRTRQLVDDIVLVEDDELVAAMRMAAETLGVLLEPAGAAGLAAIAGHDVPGEVVATVLTGGNADLATWPGDGQFKPGDAVAKPASAAADSSALS